MIAGSIDVCEFCSVARTKICKLHHDDYWMMSGYTIEPQNNIIAKNREYPSSVYLSSDDILRQHAMIHRGICRQPGQERRNADARSEHKNVAATQIASSRALCGTLTDKAPSSHLFNMFFLLTFTQYFQPHGQWTENNVCTFIWFEYLSMDRKFVSISY